MSIAVTCPGCGATMKAPDALAGKKSKCPKCASAVSVPAVAVAEAPPLIAPRKKKKGGAVKLLACGCLVFLLGGGCLSALGVGGGLTVYFKFPEYLPAFLASTPPEFRYLPD